LPKTNGKLQIKHNRFTQITITDLVVLHHPIFREFLWWQWKSGPNTSANDRSGLSRL